MGEERPFSPMFSLFSPCRCVRAVVLGSGGAASRAVPLCRPSGGIVLVLCVREFLHVLPSSRATSAPTRASGRTSVRCAATAARRPSTSRLTCSGVTWCPSRPSTACSSSTPAPRRRQHVPWFPLCSDAALSRSRSRGCRGVKCGRVCAQSLGCAGTEPAPCAARPSSGPRSSCATYASTRGRSLSRAPCVLTALRNLCSYGATCCVTTPRYCPPPQTLGPGQSTPRQADSRGCSPPNRLITVGVCLPP